MTPKKSKKVDITTEIIEQTITTLRSEDYHENWLLLLLISRYYLYLGTLIQIRFEDFGTNKDSKRFFKISFLKEKKRYEAIYVDEETFEAVRELKGFRMKCKK